MEYCWKAWKYAIIFYLMRYCEGQILFLIKWAGMEANFRHFINGNVGFQVDNGGLLQRCWYLKKKLNSKYILEIQSNKIKWNLYVKSTQNKLEKTNCGNLTLDTLKCKKKINFKKLHIVIIKMKRSLVCCENCIFAPHYIFILKANFLKRVFPLYICMLTYSFHSSIPNGL